VELTSSFCARAYVELGRYTEAEPLLKRAIALDPSDSNSFNHLADAYRDQGKYRNAERL
jgi:predicted Zn-dependent protease